LENTNGADGYETILKEQPELVIADIRMPGMSGIQLLHKIRTENINTIFIILSGYDLFQYAKSAIEDGAFAYLLKPVDQQELEKVLNSAEVELVRRESLDKEHQKLQYHYTQSRQALIHQFLSESVFRQAYKLDEFHNKAAQLDLKFPHAVYFIAVIRILPKCVNRSFSNMNDLMSEIINITQNKLIGRNIVGYSFTAQNDICFICNHSNDELKMHTDIIEFFHEIEYECRKLVCPDVFTGVSKPCVISEWQNGYRAAINVVDSQILTALAAHDSRSQKGNIDGLLKDDQKQNLIQCIMQNRVEDLDSCLDMIFAPFFFDLRNNTHARNNFCLYLIMLCMKTLDEKKIDSTQLIGDEFELYREACSLKNPSDSLAWIREKLHLCAKESDLRNDAEKNPDNFNISDIESFIREHFSDDLSLKVVAERFHYTSSYLSRMFKEKTGQNLTKYLNHCRLSEAKRLLIGTQLQVSKVAKLVGFNDYKHFVSEFKKHTGYVPISYREHFKNIDL